MIRLPWTKNDDEGFNLKEALKQHNIIHTGRLFRYKNHNRWKQAWLVLDKNGTLLWFNDKHCTTFKAKVNLTEAAPQIEVAEGALARYPGFTPSPPYEVQPHFIAIPLVKSPGKTQKPITRRSTKGQREKPPKLTWFCARNGRDVGEWTEAFAVAMDRENEFKYFKAQLPREKATRKESTMSMNSEGGTVLKKGAAITSARKDSIPYGWGYVWDMVRRGAMESHQGLTGEIGGHSSLHIEQSKIAQFPMPNGNVSPRYSYSIPEEMTEPFDDNSFSETGLERESNESNTRSISQKVSLEIHNDAGQPSEKNSFQTSGFKSNGFKSATASIRLAEPADSDVDVVEFECLRKASSYVLERKESGRPYVVLEKNDI